jgi:hypothetical protein
MSIETPQTTPSLEELKETYKQKLNSILYKNLTVDNIDTFADESLKNLTSLVEEIIQEYKTNETLELNKNLSPREQEDDAFNKLGLTGIQETLDIIIEVKDKIDKLKEYINGSKKTTDETLIPPETGIASISIGSGEGVKEKKLIPRLLTLLYIIETDFDILKEDITITEGTTNPNIVRKNPYIRVEIPDIERTVYICDEEGNASYVFDTEKLDEEGISLENIDISNKSEINNLLSEHPGIGARIVQSKNWRTNISELLRQPITEKIQEEKGDEFTTLTSEFKKREKKNFLAFEDFQNEVINLYTGESNVQDWYKKEKKNHFNWPTHPFRTFKNNGWIGWSELVGKENPSKKEFLPFEKFQAEAKTLYPGEGDVYKWYNEERKNHTDWPSNPNKTYNNNGWFSFSELVGKENKEFLSFKNFKTEVRNLYPGKGNVSEWYHKEVENHPKWPSNPNKTYRNKGWIDWSELVGKENHLKKGFLPFENLKDEVRTLYPEKGDIQFWYRKERKSHPNWPANPYKTYKNKGWTNWPSLVEKNTVTP